MAVKTELIARMLAQVEDFQRQLARVVALLTGHNSLRRTLRRLRLKNVAPITPIPIADGRRFGQGEYGSGSIEVYCHKNRDLWDALQIEKEFRAVTIPPIEIPDWIAKPEQE